METPNTPSELFALQAGANDVDCVDSNEDVNAFADYVCDELIPDLEPTPYQTVKAIERMLGKLKAYHFEVLHDEDNEMDAWCRTLWQEDYQRLSTALDAVRLINPD